MGKRIDDQTSTSAKKNMPKLGLWGAPSIPWTEYERSIIRKYFPTHSPAAMADAGLLPGRTWRAIKRQALKIGLRRNGNYPTIVANGRVLKYKYLRHSQCVETDQQQQIDDFLARHGGHGRRFERTVVSSPQMLREWLRIEFGIECKRTTMGLFVIGGKTYSFSKMIDFVDDLRAKKGLPSLRIREKS